jgi:hypothetical protein
MLGGGSELTHVIKGALQLEKLSKKNSRDYMKKHISPGCVASRLQTTYTAMQPTAHQDCWAHELQGTYLIRPP